MIILSVVMCRNKDEGVDTLLSKIDGLRSYFYALAVHFGGWCRPENTRKDHCVASDDLIHGQLRKRKTRRTFYTLTHTDWANDMNSQLFISIAMYDILRTTGDSPSTVSSLRE